MRLWIPEPKCMVEIHFEIRLAYERLLSSASKRKLKGSKPNIQCFVEGDEVMIRTHPLSSAEDSKIKKLFLLYEGPFKISRRVGANAYEVIDFEGKVKGFYNVFNLKPYKRLSHAYVSF
nr:unnamed protein product [Callosobruchus analis]